MYYWKITIEVFWRAVELPEKIHLSMVGSNLHDIIPEIPKAFKEWRLLKGRAQHVDFFTTVKVTRNARIHQIVPIP